MSFDPDSGVRRPSSLATIGVGSILNETYRIEQELGSGARYAGKRAIKGLQAK